MRKAKEKLGMATLRALRSERGINQTDMAREMGVSRSAVAMWETGRSSPDNATLLKIADFFDVTVDYLLGHTAEQQGEGYISREDRPEAKQTIFYRMAKDGIGAETLTASEVRELENYARFLIARRSMKA